MFPSPIYINRSEGKVRKLVLSGLVQVLLVLAGCGGGSGTVATSTSNNGSSGNNGQSSNSVTITVDSGPDPSVGYDVDTPFVTVTVCAPGSTTNCQQIDHVEVDTGSFGLRVMSSVLNASLASALRQETSSDGNSVVECTMFADGFSWGPVKIANVQMAGESASSVPIQVIGDPAYEQTSGSGSTAISEIPTACSGTGPEEDTVATFGANAILGMGAFADDCGSDCGLPPSDASNPAYYYECPATSWSPGNPCSEAALAESAQVTDPVTGFQTDNNGVIVELPSATEGAGSLTGTLIFGIGTEGNNTYAAKTLLTANPGSGTFSTEYTTQGGTQQFLPYSILDTGSNAYYFADDSIPSVGACSSYPGYDSSNPDTWFCPGSELELSATNTGQNGTQSTVAFSIGNAYTLFQRYSGSVFDDLGASSGSQDTNCADQSSAAAHNDCSFDFGFPFFLGKNVYIAFAGANTSQGTGPYFAY